MSTDTASLVAELRGLLGRHVPVFGNRLVDATLLARAADEIERLQREVERLSTTRQAIGNETLERAAVDLEMEISGVDVELRPTLRWAVDIIRPSRAPRRQPLSNPQQFRPTDRLSGQRRSGRLRGWRGIAR